MPKVAVVYHSGFGHTKVLAESVARGAGTVEGTDVIIISADELPNPDADRQLGGRWSELDDADAIIFGCPTYMGSASMEMRRVFEAASGIWFQQAWKDKIAAGFTNSQGLSGDKLSCLQAINQFCAQQSMIWVNLGLMPEGASPENANRLSSWLGAMAQSDNAPADQTPPSGDHKTAEHLGSRVATITARFVG